MRKLLLLSLLFICLFACNKESNKPDPVPDTFIRGTDLSFAQLKDSVYHYMESIITVIQPEYVSLGNEINGGMLWEQGRINNGTNLYQLLEQADLTNNVIGLADQLIPAYPATPQGQEDFMTALKETIKSATNGTGFCYWGGEWIAFKGPLAQNGSSWENQALFDFDNHALPVINVFQK